MTPDTRKVASGPISSLLAAALPPSCWIPESLSAVGHRMCPQHLVEICRGNAKPVENQGRAIHDLYSHRTQQQVSGFPQDPGKLSDAPHS